MKIYIFEQQAFERHDLEGLVKIAPVSYFQKLLNNHISILLSAVSNKYISTNNNILSSFKLVTDDKARLYRRVLICDVPEEVVPDYLELFKPRLQELVHTWPVFFGLLDPEEIEGWLNRKWDKLPTGTQA